MVAYTHICPEVSSLLSNNGFGIGGASNQVWSRTQDGKIVRTSARSGRVADGG